MDIKARGGGELPPRMEHSVADDCESTHGIEHPLLRKLKMRKHLSYQTPLAQLLVSKLLYADEEAKVFLATAVVHCGTLCHCCPQLSGSWKGDQNRCNSQVE